MLPLSLFDNTGIDVGSGTRNMNYLYGLADFFSYVFEDSEKTNLLLEATATEASEIYSNFLQLTSSMTLAGIQAAIGTTIKLILIRSTDQEGSTPKYLVNTPIQAIKYLSDRPFLPTDVLENDVDFRVTQIDTESCYIEFAKPLANYAFSKRLVSDGSDEFAIWASDVKIDAQLMYKHYGKILGVAPEVSSEQFSDLIYGLYYLYLNGPTLQVVEQGLNLALGIPLVRNPGSVLDIRINGQTNQYIVITDVDQYIIPAGVIPIVKVGDYVDVGTPLAKWVELTDFKDSGKWWTDVSIPDYIIRPISPGQASPVAYEGSNYDYLMSTYLYKNTFLVRINVGTFQSNKYFSQLSEILTNIKPAYTQPIFVWRLDFGLDVLPPLSELAFSTSTAVASTATGVSIGSRPINSRMIN